MVAALAVILKIYNKTSEDNLYNIDIDKVIELIGGSQDSQLAAKMKPEDYGSNIYMEVLDTSNQIIYKTKESSNKGYTTQELSCIPNGYRCYDAYLETYVNQDGVKQYQVTYYQDTDDEQNQEEYVIVDDNHNLVAASFQMSHTHFTEKEFLLLTQSFKKDWQVMKYQFRNNREQIRTLVVYKEFYSARQIEQNEKNRKIGVYVFLAIYIITVIFFINWLNRKVKKPLGLLSQAMLEVADADEPQRIHYQGSREFENICDSFNGMTARLKTSEKERTRLVETKQKMLADISHDLKTPITVIRGYTKAINDGLIQEENQRAYLATIDQRAIDLTQLIDEFSEYNKLEHPEFHLQVKEQDLNEMIREYLAQKYTDITLNGGNLDVQIPEEPYKRPIDAFQIRRALDNLIQNAVSHNQSNITIFVKITKENDKEKIVVADNGSGIPEKCAETIFEPFVVCDEARESGKGTGLGLAIARKIIEAHGGAIWIQYPPDPPYATEFIIEL